METKRAQTLEALETFIQTQRTLLERTQTDIIRLQKLRSDAIAQPDVFVSDLSAQLNANSFRLSEQEDCQHALPQNVDWSLYEGRDPASLQALARATQCHGPSLYQRSPLSDLQKFVKEARQTIVDPVLSHFAMPLEPDPVTPELESDLSVSKPRTSTEELKRERERQKLRKLKERKILGHSGLGLPSAVYSSPTHGRNRGPSGVFVRRDVEDENEEVDIDLSFNHDVDNSLVQSFSSSSTPMEADLPSPSSTSGTLSQRVSPPLRHTSRVRRPSSKLRATQDANGVSTATSNTTGPRPRRGTTTKRKRGRSTEPEPDPEPVPSIAKSMHYPDKPRASGKPKSETYKQAWSVSEQYLLEQLLEQIPDGAKNRWQKISRAMDGKRTPRQVASRVQKYFEKLKRFGIGTASGSLEGTDA